MKLVLTGLAASAAALACSLPANAAETLEVVATPETNRSVTISAADPIGQSFTAFTDTITSVGFQFASLNPSRPNSPITLNIFSGETLTGTSLFSTAFTLPASINSRTPTWFDIAIPDLAVTNGAMYSLVLTTDSSARNALVVGPGYSYANGGGLTGGDAYVGGKLMTNWASIYSNCKGAANNCDANFRVTGDITAAAVPEPAAWALFILGFGAVGGAMRTSRKRTAVTFA
ncbi:PEPxxWA-CTERM sorting domain-containing protein [Qipengyuania sp.]|uniref:PEPxxWA-CTERM sorting domain-containing protein n=1 Tax=Qipengyuania sp. TaxID=2004515 RepID=UPI0035C81C4C